MTTRRILRHTAAIYATAMSLALAGCLERKERITVDPAGRVSVHAEFKSDSLDEIIAGDTAPSLRGGWIVDEKLERDQEGKETHILTADAFFGAGAKLPASYAAPGDADVDLYLQFPTTLTVEHRADGTYYHFHRIYAPRPWAQIDMLRRGIEKQLKEVSDKPKEQVTHEDRMLSVKALVEFDLQKKLTFARAAYRDAAPTAPQDGWLALRAAVLAMLDEVDYDRIARLIENPDDNPESAKLIEGEAKAFDAAVLERMKTMLHSAKGFGGGQLPQFEQRYDWHKRYHEITEDLADDAFEITVQLPGRIIGSNADQSSDDSATWRFNGEVMRDREFELMVSSRLEK